MDLASWVLLGIIIGIGANGFDWRENDSIIGWIGVSVLGALLGGLLGSVIFPSVISIEGFNLEAFTLSAVTSVGLIFAVEFALPKNRRIKKRKGFYIRL